MRGRNAAVGLLVLLLLGMVACGGGDGGSTPAPRNVLLIFTEDHGAQLGAYGTPGVLTPNMDALARAGTLYRQAYISFATCTGSKSAIMTGRINHSIGVTANVQDYVGSYEQLAAENPPWFSDPNSEYNRFRIRDDVPTLIEVLHAQGYYLGLQNKLHMSPHRKFPFDRWYRDDRKPYEQVSDFIRDAQAGRRPWYLQHVINVSHRPYPDADARPLDVDAAAVQPPAYLPDTPTVRQDWSEYLQAVRDADRHVGLVLDALRDSGEAERTLVVLLGDHGPSYHRSKYTTYRLGLQVPLIVAGPNVVAGAVRDGLFSGIDLMPTLLDVLQVSPPAGIQGRSHARELSGVDSRAVREFVIGETGSDRSISDGRYRLVFMPDPAATFMPADNRDFDPWRNRVYRHIVEHRQDSGFASFYRLLDMADVALPDFTRPRLELYDELNDPWAINDLADDAAHAGVRDRLRLALRDWMDDTADPVARP